MNDTRLDQLLRQSLTSEQPKKELNQAIHARLEAEQASGKVGVSMKHRNRKKIFVAAAALCAIVAVAAGAYSAVVARSSSSSMYGEFTSYEQLAQAEKKAHLDINAVETFSNGYTFETMSVADCVDTDEDDNVIREYKGITIGYKKGNNPIYLDTYPVNPNEVATEERNALDTATIDGVKVSYYNDTFKFVPPDYELTDEDRINEKRDNYTISYGSDQVRETVISTVSWVQDDVSYVLQSLNGEIPSETLFSMAKEIITAK